MTKEDQNEAYKAGKNLGEFMRAERAEGRYDYDCRFDLADAAKIGQGYFAAFKRGLDDGMKAER